MKSKLFLAGAALLVGIGSTSVSASVGSRVQESNSSIHPGVLAYVRDASPVGLKIEKYFFGQGMDKVVSAAPRFLIQIVEPAEIPGGALPGSFVILTPAGNRVVAMQRGYNTISDLKAFVAVTMPTLYHFPTGYAPAPNVAQQSAPQ